MRLDNSKGGVCQLVASDDSLLWISGGPGLGKTMLSIYLTEYLSSYLRPLEDGKCHYSTYFFCDAKVNTRNSAVAIVRGLLFQLLQQKSDLIKHTLPTYEVQKEQMFQQSSFETIWSIFVKITNAIGDSPVSCVLDGLDECEPASLQEFLNKLNKITSTSPGLKMIVLSREYPSCLGASLGQFSRIRLDPDAKSEVSDGLDLYISARVAELSESKKYPAELTDHVKRTLRDKSAGTYLWVSFVVKDLQKIEVSEVEESLDQLPEGLYPLYERILEQVNQAQRGLTLDILRWCTFAVRPLTIGELASALKVKSTSLLDQKSVLRGKLTYCGHFLSISTDVISLVHQSAYDFLTNRISNCEKTPWFSLSRVELEHSKLASASIAYFLDAYLEDEDIFNMFADKWLLYPFLLYAAQKWCNHFNDSNQHGVKILEEYPQFFLMSSVWNNWADRRFGDNNREVIFVAAKLGLTVLMQRILKERGHSLYWKYLFARTLKENALCTASNSGHLSIVELLIKNGVHVDCENENKNTPLSIAVLCGHREVADFLLTCGANINGKSPWVSPLKIAIQLGKPEVIKLLLEWKPLDCPRPGRRRGIF